VVLVLNGMEWSELVWCWVVRYGVMCVSAQQTLGFQYKLGLKVQSLGLDSNLGNCNTTSTNTSINPQQNKVDLLNLNFGLSNSNNTIANFWISA
jgi:hypothetical protein